MHPNPSRSNEHHRAGTSTSPARRRPSLVQAAIAVVVAASGLALVAPTSVEAAPVAASPLGAPLALAVDDQASLGERVTMARGDLDGDGLDDLVRVGRDRARLPVLEVHHSDGDGGFRAPIRQQVDVEEADGLRAVAVGDVNGDGRPDVVVVPELGRAMAHRLPMGPASRGTPSLSNARLAVALTDVDGTPGTVRRTGAATSGTTSGPARIELVDIDRDGHLDAIVLEAEPRLGIYLGDGTGEFVEHQVFDELDGRSRDLAVADIDGDGHPDLAVSAPDRATLALFRYDPATASYSASTTSPLVDVTGIDRVVAADFDGDGDVDLLAVLTSPEGSSLALWRNLGDGTLGHDPNDRTPIAGATRADEVLTSSTDVVADLDGDGAADLVLAGGHDDLVTVAYGDGAGGFDLAMVGAHTGQRRGNVVAVVPGRFVGPGVDLVSLARDPDGYHWSTLAAAAGPRRHVGTWGVAGTPGTPDASRHGLAVADLDGDGRRDLVTYEAGDGSIWFQRQGADRTFGSPEQFAPGAASGTCGWDQGALLVADLTGDGRPDVVCPHTGEAPSRAGVARNTWPATSTVAPLTAGSSGSHRGVAAADLDGDGRFEVITYTVGADQTASVEVHQVDETGSAVVAAVALSDAAAGAAEAAVVIADATGDGVADIIVHRQAGAAGAEVAVVPVDADGALRAVIASPSSAPTSKRSVALEVTGDGHLDLITPTPDGLHVVPSNGDGTFAAGYDVSHSAAASTTVGLAVGDLTGDGLDDLAVVRSDRLEAVPVLTGGGLGDPVVVHHDPRARTWFNPTAAIADLDGDGLVELVTVLHDRHIVAFPTAATTGAEGMADLVVSAVETPSTTTVGDPLVIRWTVRNTGDAEVTRSWADRVTLVLGEQRTTLARQATTEVLPPGGSLHRELTVDLPLVTAGARYRIEVETNENRSVSERDVANNRGASGTFTVDVPVLPTGGQRAVTLSPDHPVALVRTPAGGPSPHVVSVLDDGGAGLDLYLGDGAVPTRTDHVARMAPGATAVALPSTPTAPATYVRVESHTALAGPVTVVLESVPLASSAVLVSAATVGAGTVTVEVATSGLGDEPAVGLLDGDRYRPATAVRSGTDRLWATFDLHDVTEITTFDLEVLTVRHRLTVDVDDPEAVDWGTLLTQETITREELYAANPLRDKVEALEAKVDTRALTVDPALPAGRVEIRLATPEAARAGRNFSATLHYANVGHTDVPAPLVVVSAGAVDGLQLGLEDDPQTVNRHLQVLAAPQVGLGDRLLAGQSDSARVVVRAPRSALHATIPMSASIVDTPTTDGPDWAKVLDTSVLADTAGIERTRLLADLESAMGPSWHHYAERLRATAASGPVGTRIERSVPRLVERVIALAAAAQVEAPVVEPLEGPEASTRRAAVHPALFGPAGIGVMSTTGDTFGVDPPNTDTQWYYGDDDPRNWSSAKARAYALTFESVSGSASLNPIRRGYSWSTSVFSDHLDHWQNGDGSPRHYSADDNFARAVAGDRKVQEFFNDGPAVRRRLNEYIRSNTAGLECGQERQLRDRIALEAPSGGIGLDFELFDAVYGLGKIPKARLDVSLTVSKDDNGVVTYTGKMNVSLQDSYTWVYEDSGDEYQHWDPSDKNFKAWYLEHYGITKPFDLIVDLGEWETSGTVPNTNCGGGGGNGPDDDQEPPEAPELPDEPDSGPFEVDNVGSTDPNDKQSSGAGPRGAIRPGDRIDYTIRFENLDEATAPAQEVVVVDELDPALDLASFELTSLGFGVVRVSVPPGRQSYETVVVAPTDPDHPVRVTVQLDHPTRTVTWTMRSHDPATGELPDDPFAGFLPPNDAAGTGEGWVAFSVDHVAGLVDGDSWLNEAEITFDDNDPIVTDSALVTIDARLPSAEVGTLPAESDPAIAVTWTGSDTVGPVIFYDVWVSVDGAAAQPWLRRTTATGGTYQGEPGRRYEFTVQPTDRVGWQGERSGPGATVVRPAGGGTSTTSTTVAGATTSTTVAGGTTSTTVAGATTTSSIVGAGGDATTTPVGGGAGPSTTAAAGGAQRAGGPTAPTGPLSRTGSDPLRLAIPAAVLLLAGVAATAWARRTAARR